MSPGTKVAPLHPVRCILHPVLSEDVLVSLKVESPAAVKTQSERSIQRFQKHFGIDKESKKILSVNSILFFRLGKNCFYFHLIPQYSSLAYLLSVPQENGSRTTGLEKRDRVFICCFYCGGGFRGP